MKSTTEKLGALARKDELVVQDLPDELLVYDLKSHKAHCLNKTAAFIWKHCDGQRTAEDIAKMMETEWRTPVTEDSVWVASKCYPPFRSWSVNDSCSDDHCRPDGIGWLFSPPWVSFLYKGYHLGCSMRHSDW